MTEAQAVGLVAKLVAAFPHPKVEPLTVQVYAEALAPLRHYDGALAAVNALIRDARMLPRVADILDEYDRIKDRYDPPALPEAPMSEAQRIENLRQARAMTERLAGAREVS